MKYILLMLICFVLCSCTQHKRSRSDAETMDSVAVYPLAKHSKANSIYFWKTTYNPNKSELDFLKRHDIRRMYIRFFDVAVDNYWLGNESLVIPIATTTFKQPLPKIEIIPTVFITLEAMRCTQGKESEFAHKIITRILAMAEFHDIKQIKEMQFDCDWTETTQESYFRMCQIARDTLNSRGLTLSATIRLHQLKKKCPPVDRGVLMLYNTGSLKKANTENSILKYEDVKPYFQKRKYTLPLDFAYPTFAWGVWFRDGKFKAILRRTDYSDQTLYSLSKDGIYKVVKKHLLESHQLQDGDIIRLENSGFDEILRVKKLAEKEASQASVVLYHLDSTNLSKYTTDEIETIYSRL